MEATTDSRIEALTARQREVLDYIAQEIARTGVAPTIREIGAAMGISSTNGVKDHLRALEKRGVLVHQPGKIRTLKVLVAVPGAQPRCVCSEALALLNAGQADAARELLASVVRGQRAA